MALLENFDCNTYMPLTMAAEKLQVGARELLLWLSTRMARVQLETNESGGGRLWKTSCYDLETSRGDNYRDAVAIQRLIRSGRADVWFDDKLDATGRLGGWRTLELSGVSILVGDVILFRNCVHSSDAPTVQMPFMDRTHEFYSEELAIAVDVWLALYGDGGKHQPNKAIKGQIRELIKDKGLSAEAIERVATLVNPRKRGGTPPS